MKIGLLLLSLVLSLSLVVALVIGLYVLSRNIPIFLKLFRAIRLGYGILYLKTLNLFGKKKWIRSFFVKLQLNGEETLSESLKKHDPAQLSLDELNIDPPKSSKSTSQKRDKKGRFCKG